MKFKLVAFDCDGVLVDTRSSWQWIHDHFGVNNQEGLDSYHRKEIDIMEFIRRDIALWKSVEPQVSKKMIREILLSIPPMKGVEELTKALRDNGTQMVIISGGLDLLVDEITQRIKAIAGYSNGLVSDANGLLTGEGIQRIEPRNKQGPLLEVMEGLGIKRKEVAAVGDTKDDSNMFIVSSFGVAFNPADDIIRSRADVVVEERDLTKLMDILL